MFRIDITFRFRRWSSEEVLSTVLSMQFGGSGTSRVYTEVVKGGFNYGNLSGLHQSRRPAAGYDQRRKVARAMVFQSGANLTLRIMVHTRYTVIDKINRQEVWRRISFAP